MKKVFYLITALFVLFLVSCKNPFDTFEDAYVSIAVDESFERVVFPAARTWDDVDKICFYANSTLIKTWESSANSTAYENMDDNSVIKITAGTYDFTVELYDASNIIFASATLKSVRIKNGANPLVFNAQRIVPEGEKGFGSLKLSLSWLDDTDIGAVYAGLFAINDIALPLEGFDFSDCEIDEDSKTAFYEVSDVPAGTYFVKYELYSNMDAGGILSYTFCDVVVIENLKETAGSFEIDKLNTYYTISYDLGGAEWAEDYEPVEFYNANSAVVLPTELNLVNLPGHFVGWYDNPDFEGSPYKYISAGLKKNLNLYAKYVDCAYLYDYELSSYLAGLKATSEDIYYITILDEEVDFGYLTKPLSLFRGKIILDLSNCTAVTYLYSSLRNMNCLYEVYLPDSITEIEYYAFENCGNLRYVRLPSNLRYIEERAFYNCESLENLEIPANLERLSPNCFVNCKNLNLTVDAGNSYYEATADGKGLIYNDVMDYKSGSSLMCYFGCGDVILEGDFDRISSGAFENNTQITSVDIRAPVLEIQDNAFSNCESLISVTLPDTLESIQSYAFSYCSNLENIKLPASLISLSASSFNGCNNLSISIDEENPYLAETTDGKGIISLESNCLSYYSQRGGDIVIPEGVKSIGEYLFNDCYQIDSITFPEGLESIGSYCFSNCSNLTQISIPDTVTYIWSGAFSNCNKLEEVILPSGLREISNYLLAGCKNLQSVYIPASVSIINKSAFSGCSDLRIHIEESNEYYSTDDTERIVFSVDGDTIYFSLGVTGELIIPEGVKKIADRAFSESYQITSVVLPSTLEEIGCYAFLYCYNLGVVEIPDSVTSIGYGAFQECHNLRDIKLPNGITILPSNMLWRTAITSLTIPESVTFIGSNFIYTDEKYSDGSGDLESIIFEHTENWLCAYDITDPYMIEVDDSSPDYKPYAIWYTIDVSNSVLNARRVYRDRPVGYCRSDIYTGCYVDGVYKDIIYAGENPWGDYGKEDDPWDDSKKDDDNYDDPKKDDDNYEEDIPTGDDPKKDDDGGDKPGDEPVIDDIPDEEEDPKKSGKI